MELQTVLLAFFIPLACCLNQDENWTRDVIYYQPQNLTCENDHIALGQLPTGYTLTWILPSGEILRPGQKHPRVHIADSGYWLNINRTNDEDFGVYNCLIFVNGVLTYNVRIGVNVNGPYWGNSREKYVPQAITAAIASSITFVVAAVLCFCYEKQQARGEAVVLEYDAMMKEKLDQNGTDNAAFVGIDPAPEKTLVQDGVEAQTLNTKF